jgi:S-DNA-T family DNA segregation ATPase FtsK/SpoIIIE
MRVTVTAVSPAMRRRADVLIDADPETPVSEIAARLNRLLDGGIPQASGPLAGHATLAGGHPAALSAPVLRPAGRAPVPGLFAAGQRVPGDTALADSLIRDGSVLSLGDPSGCRRPDPAGVAEIRVVAGPAAGMLQRLPFGEVDIGGPVPGDAGVVIPDPSVPPSALRVFIDPDGFQVAPFAGVRALLDRQPLETTTEWWPGQQVAVGGTFLEIAPYDPPDAALRPAEDGAGLEFNRPPRLLPPEPAHTFTMPGPPAKPDRRPVPILMAVVPVILGVAMAYFLRQVYMLAMAAFSPVMLLGSYVSDRRHGRKSYAQQLADHRDREARIEHDAHAALDAERLRRRFSCPDPATVLGIATGPRKRLWERRRSDPDYLLLRVGTADLPSQVQLTDPSQDEHRRRRYWLIPDAPVTISLSERPVAGVAGQADLPKAAGRWLAAQIAVLHSPEDVQLTILTDAAGQDGWDWVRWLPHCRPAEGQDCAVLIGTDAETVTTRIAELQAIITARLKTARDHGGTVRFRHDIVVIFDGSRTLRSLPGAIAVLRDGPVVRVYSICLDAEERMLPAECEAVAASGPDGMLIVQQRNQPAVGLVRPEGVTAAWCAAVARPIAPVRDVSGEDEAAMLPDACRLLDLLALEPLSPDRIAGYWHGAGRSTTAVIGACYDGPFCIDLRRDGPHALIAGTTGAGKSELLQTLIASLAVANRPDAMNFVLVDYKGGSAFKDAVHLPHVVGMVTDLDAHLTQRALTSLSAELTRRERILAAAGVKDIEDYTVLLDRQAHARHRAGPGTEPMPRLVIVIDEFASLARDLPEFVAGLVSIAQRGRSLGIHLILATQRPSGVVSADIRTNTNLRIALRVTDVTESADVIDAPDSARIARTTPGRGFVRLGHGSLVPFQAARVGGLRPGARAAVPPWIMPIGWPDLGRPEPVRPPAAQHEEEVTDLAVLVEQTRLAASQLGFPVQPSPWLAPLPARVLLSDLAQGRGGGDEGMPFGVIDLPDFQRQEPAVLSLSGSGHLMAAGAPRSGRSQLLRTIAATIAVHASAADVHLYGIDCGNGALQPIAGLPHCGAVVTRTQEERVTRLLHRLAAELDRRQGELAEWGYTSITEQRADVTSERRLPHIIVLLDRWEGFTVTLGDTGGGELTSIITRILAEGASAGVHLVMTGDRSLLAGRIAAMCEDKLVFKLAEREDYALAGLRPRDIPQDIPPGRCFRTGTGAETQVALLGPDPSGQGQAAALIEIAAWATELDTDTPASQRPFRVDVLPTRITFDDAWKLRAAGAGPMHALAGVGGDELTALGPDLAAGVPAFIIAGPAQSGRSAILAAMTRSLTQAGSQVILVTPRPSPLRALASLSGVIASLEDPALTGEELQAALASLTGPGVVVIDDADLLTGCEGSGELSQIIRHGTERHHALVIAGESETLASGFGGWHVDARRARRGCLTAPLTIPEGDLIGARLTHAHTGHQARPGRGLLNTGDGKLITITVPET